MTKVAIIGAGPGGLAAGRWLKREGFEPVLFEQGSSLGGQWSGDPMHSGIWPSMHTNTCREMTQFSDLPHRAGTPLYPSNRAMLAYLKRYAERFDLLPRIRLRTRVVSLARQGGDGWIVRFRGDDDVEREAVYSHVVVASGRFNKPKLPVVPGLESFRGSRGAIHAFHYKEPTRYFGQRVLVAGCAVSALEIASDLAMLGAARVVTASRRQRYIVQKIVAGVPIEHLMQTRDAAMVQESSPRAAAANLKELIIATSGHPEAFGALKPDEDLMKAGVAQCQHYLPLVSEGRICAKPWISAVDGKTVRFCDGTAEEFDGLIFGTGFELNLPFLSDTLRELLEAGDQRPNLYRCTFHPDLPGLAFAGIFQLTGPYFPPIELQARWIAYAWSGARPLPPQKLMKTRIAAESKHAVDKLHMPTLMVQLAREAGIEPDLEQWPDLRHALLYGPLTPISFRLNGRDPLLEAAARVAETDQIARSLRSRLLTAQS